MRELTFRDEAGAADEEPVSFKQIAAFLAAAENRSITKAANKLHMTQSGLSRVINSLECVLGQSLFDRKSNGLALTAFGNAFMPHAVKLQNCYADTLAAAAVPTPRHLVLAGSDFVLNAVLPALMQELSGCMAASTRLQMLSMASHQVLDEVASGNADIGLCMYGGSRGNVDCIPLLNAPLGILTSDVPGFSSDITTLDDLARLPMVRLADEMVLPQLLHDCGVRFDAYFNAGLVANNMLTLFAAVRGGSCATIVSAVAAATPQAKGLRFKGLPHLLPSLQLCLVTRLGAGQTHQKLAHALRRSVQNLDWPPEVSPVLLPN